MNFTRRSSSNNLVRQVLKQIIADPLPPPTSSRKSVELEQIKINQAVTYLERKIERQQSEIKILSEQLGKEIECKEHLMMLVTEEKEKNSKLSGHLSNANKLNGEMKKKIGKMETVECKQGKLREEYELKIAKGKDMLRKKQEQLLRASARIQELQASTANITHIQRELKQLREKMKVMSQRQTEMAKQIRELSCELQEEREKSKAKDETILFSEEHLRRLRSEYQEFQYEQYKEQEEWRTIQVQMKNLLEKQNEQIKALNQQLATRRHTTDHDNSRQENSVHSFHHYQRPEFQLSVFKSQLKRTLTTHIPNPNLRHSLESDLIVILQAIETNFNGILDQIQSEIQ